MAPLPQRKDTIMLEIKNAQNTYVLTLNGKQFATVLLGLANLAARDVRERLQLEDEMWDSYLEVYKPINRTLEKNGIIDGTIAGNLIKIARS